MLDDSSNKHMTQKRRIARAMQITAWVMFSFVLSFALMVGVMTLLQAVGLAGVAENPVVQVTIISILVYTIALVIVVGVPAWRRQWSLRYGLERLGLTKLRWRDWQWLPVAYAVYLGASLLLIAVASWLIPGFDVDEVQDLGFEQLYGIEYVIGFVALVVLAPIAEELLFRGYLFGTLRRYIAFLPASLVTSVLFGLVHGQWNVGLDTFALSMVLCWVREKTGGVWVPIGLHAVKNSLAFVLLFVV